MENQATATKIGIWMDHANAHLIEFTSDPMQTQTIKSEFTHEAKEQSLGKSEHVMHNKEQHQQTGYYKKLGEIIKKYEAALLFGPTEARVELFNMLKADRHFDDIKIEMMPADKMTDHQQHAFVRDHFTKKH